MKRTLAAALCLGLLVWALPARAQDKVALQDGKTVSGTVSTESAKGVVLKGGKGLIPAEDIRDVEYDASIPDFEIRLKVYRPATTAEADARKAKTEKERLKYLDVALAKYRAALAKIKERYPHRQIEYKVAALTAEKAELTGGKEGKVVAIGKLQDFAKKHPDSWQIARVLRTLARMQVEQRNFEGAGETLKALAGAPVSEAIRQEAELAGAQLSMKAGKYAEARPKLEAFAARLPKDSPAGQKARVYAAECLAALKDVPAARSLAQKVLAEAKEPDVKAAAYNALGYCDFLADNFKEARWDFLWVDLMYNQDPAEHARALYYLSQVFARLNEPDRAQECLETLLSDRRFTGLDYQRKAQEEQKQQK